MKVSFQNPFFTYNQTFGTNAHTYTNNEGKFRCSLTYLFRIDLDWKNFTDYMVNHFKDKDDVNFIQFASSDGSEAFSQIMCLLDKGVDKFFPIEAYDIDKQVVQAANSGFLNASKEDKQRCLKNGFDFDKYFTKTDKEIFMDDDAFSKYNADDYRFKDMFTDTYKVSDKLRKRVNFHNADMYDILLGLEDNSNTVLMCRNIIGYFTDREKELFTDLVARKLKRGSLFVVGEYDMQTLRPLKPTNDLDLILQHKGFIPVMENVYRKEY